MAKYQPTLKAIRTIHNILKQKLFHIVKSHVIDSEENCFTKLLMKDHICLSPKESFFVNKYYKGQNNIMLRPHSTNFQIIVFNNYCEKILEALKNNKEIRFATHGPVFRRDKSARHSYFFHQFDGLIIAHDYDIYAYITIMMSIIFEFLEKEFKYRIRESYFPFTFPSYEVDIFYNDQWIEILGCGLTHEQILKDFRLKEVINKVFAFGVGIERLCMIKYSENNIHTLRIT